MKRFTSNNFKDILLECQKHQDLAITCWNGRFQCNGFLFVTIFPGLAKVLHFENSQYDNPSIIVPDVDVNDLHCFFNNIYSESPEFYPGKSLLYLLSWKYTSSSRTPKHVEEIIQEKNKDVIKEELDFSENIDTDVNDGTADYPPLNELSPSQNCPVKIGIIKSNQPEIKRKRGRGRPIKVDKVIKARFHCDQCSKSFLFKSKLEAHIKYTHEGVPRPKIYDKQKEIRRRQLEECDQICECGIDFKSQDEKIKHYRIVHKGWIECPDCERIFKEHLFASHKCEPTKSTWRKQGGGKEGVGICPHCGKSCKTYGVLSHHKHVAHATGSFPCDICGKIYTSKPSLNDHLKKSCKAKMTPCSICGAMLKGQRGIKGHMRSVHTDDKEKRFQCGICGKGFFSQDKLNCHEMSMHIKSRPHRCRYGCDIGYNDISNRNAHEKKTHGARFDLSIKNPK